MAMFSTCRKCGCKALVVVLVGALALAAVQHQDICLREQPDGPALFCTRYVPEPAHTHERERSNQYIGWISVTAVSSGTTSTSSVGMISSGSG
jgi:hypothetical protein